MHKCALVFLLFFKFSSAYNILGVFPYPGESHFFSFKPLMIELTKKGHNVTVISYFPLKYKVMNYRDIGLGKVEDNFDLSMAESLLNLQHHDPDNRLKMYGNILLLSYLAEITCEKGFAAKNVQEFLKEKNNFDLLILEAFNTDCFIGLVRKFKCAVIGIESSTLMPYSGGRFGDPNHPAYIPNNFLPFSDKMTFFERLENVIVTFFDELYYNYVMIRKDKEIVRKYLGRKAAELETYVMNTSLLLTNSHFSLNLPRPHVPAVVEVGGLHIGKIKQLPHNIKKFIEESEHGVIYISFGSLVKAHTMAGEKLQAFLKAFSRLPQRVLWKWDNDTMEGKPDNVMIQKWMPQLDILNHPNVKAFISHGGLLGTIEAVHCGVPIVVLPQFGDQHTNAKAIEASGAGIILRMSQVTEETLSKALKKVLSSSFQSQAKDLSARFRDRPLPPLDTAIYWVEYVARHRGAPHLRTAAAGMPWYQYYLVDVILFIVTIIAIFCYSCFAVVRFIVGLRNKRQEDRKIKTS